MPKITIKEKIKWLKGLSFLFYVHKGMPKTKDLLICEAILATLEEAKKREGKCRWRKNKEFGYDNCKGSRYLRGSNFTFCPDCSKQIEWVEEGK